MKFIAYDTFLE